MSEKKKKFGGAQPGAGRPSFEPTDQQRAQVRLMVAAGVPDYDVAKVIGVSMPTMRKHFWQELEVGHIMANTKVAQTLFRQATDETNPKSVTAAIFWLKCRAGWKEAQVAEPMGKKQMQDEEAKMSHSNTGWADLLENNPANLQ